MGRKSPLPLTPEGARKLRSLVHQRPDLSPTALSREFNLNPKRVLLLRREFGVHFPQGKQKVPVTCRPLLAKVLMECRRRGANWADLARECGVHVNTVLAWRKGTYDPSLLEFECLVQLAGMELTIHTAHDIIDELNEEKQDVPSGDSPLR